ncbi:unnamed protein product, partial [Amoebophrya sp. A25]|eukprot:GSA25T00006949001.1
MGKIQIPSSELQVFGVADGHYGHEAATLLRDRFIDDFLRPAILKMQLTSTKSTAVVGEDQPGLASAASGEDHERTSTSERYNMLTDEQQQSLSTTSETRKNRAIKKNGSEDEQDVGWEHLDAPSVVRSALHLALQEFDRFLVQAQETEAGSTLTLVVHGTVAQGTSRARSPHSTSSRVSSRTARSTFLVAAQIGDCELWMAGKKKTTAAAKQDVGKDDEDAVLALGRKIEVISTGELGQIEDIRESSGGARKLYLVLLQQ